MILSAKPSISLNQISLYSCFLCKSKLFSDSGWDSGISNSVIYWPSLARGWMPSIIHLSEPAAGPSSKWQLAFSNLIRKKKSTGIYSMEIWGEGLRRSDKWTEKQTQKGQNMKTPSLFFFSTCIQFILFHLCAAIYFKGTFYPPRFALTSVCKKMHIDAL